MNVCSMTATESLLQLSFLLRKPIIRWLISSITETGDRPNGDDDNDYDKNGNNNNDNNNSTRVELTMA